MPKNNFLPLSLPLIFAIFSSSLHCVVYSFCAPTYSKHSLLKRTTLEKYKSVIFNQDIFNDNKMKRTMVTQMMIGNRSLAFSKRNGVHLLRDSRGRERRRSKNIFFPLLTSSSSTFLRNSKDPIENEKEMKKNMDDKGDNFNAADTMKSMTYSLLQSTLERSKFITANNDETYETECSLHDDNDDIINVEVEIQNRVKNSIDRANNILSKKENFVSDESSSNSNDDSSFDSSYVRSENNSSVCESTVVTTSTTTTTTTTTTTMDAYDMKDVETSISSPSSPVKERKLTSQINQNNLNTQPAQHIDKRLYLNQPAVTSTALAHVLWSQVVIPHHDTIIDCTCGNGKDSLILANMLFPQGKNYNIEQGNDNNDHIDDASIKPELICIDIQSNAIANTTELLREQPFLPNTISSPFCETKTSKINHHHCPIRVIQKSHDDNLLSTPKDKRSVGLICYNLGWLPGGNDDDNLDTKSISTEHTSTLRSLVDAVLLLRVGGLLSVMTYPGSNKLEAFAVSLFCESLAMFTSREQKKKGGWEAFIDEYTFDFNYYSSHRDDDKKMKDDYESLKVLVKENLRKVYDEGEPKQTWRVFEHKPMGRPLSPVLVTAMRIK